MFKTHSKILVTIFLFIFLLQLASLIFLLAVPETSQAGIDKLDLQVDIGETTEIEFKGSTAAIAEYIKAIYKYALGIVGILATVVMMFGGVLWITAGGNAERIANAKSWLTAALTGLVLALTSYMILYIVNPALVQFRVTPVKEVGESADSDDNIGCCLYEDSGSDVCVNTTQDNCLNTYSGDDFNLDEFCQDKKKCVKEELGCCAFLTNTTPQETRCQKNKSKEWCEYTDQISELYINHTFYKDDINCTGTAPTNTCTSIN